MSENSIENLDKSKLDHPNKKWLLTGMVVAAVLVAMGTFVFSESIETLDVKAEELGFEGFSLLPAPFPEYAIPGLEDPLVNFLLGFVSVLLVLIVAFGVYKILSTPHNLKGVSTS